MIYQHNFFYLLMGAIATIGLSRRLKTYLENYFDKTLAMAATAAILFHPLSLDAFLGPNVLQGTLAFWVFLESLVFFREKKWFWSMSLMALSSILNICYVFFPVFYFFKLPKDERQKYKLALICFCLFLIMYLSKLFLMAEHNIITFFSSFIQNLCAPFVISAYSPSLNPFSWQMTFTAVMVLTLIFWREEKNKISREFWPLILLPTLGVFFHQWFGRYRFWNEVIFSGSTYLCLTFAFVTMLAFHMPRRLFYAYTVFVIVCSFAWGGQWFPFSKALNESLKNLPEQYKEPLLAKRAYGWQLIYEGKIMDGKKYMEDLLRLTNSEEVREDLNKIYTDKLDD